jgi:hypothetical protein
MSIAVKRVSHNQNTQHTVRSFSKRPLLALSALSDLVPCPASGTDYRTRFLTWLTSAFVLPLKNAAPLLSAGPPFLYPESGKDIDNTQSQGKVRGFRTLVEKSCRKSKEYEKLRLGKLAVTIKADSDLDLVGLEGLRALGFQAPPAFSSV